jgi:hypothetical protein
MIARVLGVVVLLLVARHDVSPHCDGCDLTPSVTD